MVLIILMNQVRFVVDQDICIEDLHFQYDEGGPVAPKVYNDMITLKGNSPLIKLTISHGISQSVMLSLFENIMGCAIEGLPLLSRRCPTASYAG